jgi:hypothetical protein
VGGVNGQLWTGLGTWPWLAAAGGVLLVTVVFVVAMTGRRRSGGHPGETLLTLAAAGIATGVSATGMWNVVGDALGMGGPGRVALFAFLEIAVAVSAMRARRCLREHGTVGVDGAAVWALAGLSAALSALDSGSAKEVVLRLAAPLVAAWLWERGLAADRRALETGRRGGIAWRVSIERVLVWLRLAEPAAREVGEVDRARRLGRLVRAAWRYHTLIAAGAGRRRTGWAAARLRRRTAAAGVHLGLGADDTVRALVRAQLAALYQVQDGTAPSALADLSPWAPHAAAAGHAEARPLPAGSAGPVSDRGEDSALSGQPGEDWSGRSGQRAERTASALPVRRQPAGSGQGQDWLTGLLPIGRQVAAGLAERGQALSRPALVTALREAGHPIGTDRARELLAVLQDSEVAS